MLTTAQQHLLIDQRDIWYAKPEVFVKDMFGAEADAWQIEALKALANNNKIAIKSGHGVGKTAFLSWAIFWYVLLHADVKVPCTAPTSSQLKEILWSELKKWHREMMPAYKKMFEVNSEHVRFLNSDARFAVARTARKEQPEAFQGFHATNLLFVVDEASGVDDIIFEVGKGAMSTKGSKILMCGNPTRRTGYFFKAFYGDNSESWYKMTVNCEDIERCDREFIDDIIKEYGKDSDVYRIRVLGEFPTSEGSSFMDCTAIDKASHITMPKSTGKLVLGVDVARFGDDKTVLTWRRGRKVERIEKYRNKDTMETVGMVVNAIRDDKVFKAYIDVCGLGAGVVDRLMEMGYQMETVAVNAANKAMNPDQYNNKRTEMWGNMREWFADEAGVKIPKDEGLINDLMAPRYKYDSSGRLCLEGKDEMKKNGYRSPDCGDSLALTFAYPLNINSYKPLDMDTSWIV